MTDQTPMDAERLAEIRERLIKASPGPWRLLYDGCDCEMGCGHDRWPYAIEGPIPIDEKNRDWAISPSEIAEMRGEDADLIAHARQDIPDLLAEVARLSAEREEYERTRWSVVAQRNGALNDLEEVRAELSRLRAVIEEARYYLNRAVAETTYKEFNDDVLVAQDILDRGLKGAGE